MTAFIVSYCAPYESDMILGVFTTRDEAVACIANNPCLTDSWPEIDEWDGEVLLSSWSPFEHNPGMNVDRSYIWPDLPSSEKAYFGRNVYAPVAYGTPCFIGPTTPPATVNGIWIKPLF